MTDLKELIDDLNLLLARNNDAHMGYIETAAKVNRADVREWMQSYSTQRARFCEELKLEIKSLGGEPDDSTSLLGELHRAWIDLKGTFSDEQLEDMLEECERGETKALDNYAEVIADHVGMPASTLKMLNRHQEEIKDALVKVKLIERLVDELY